MTLAIIIIIGTVLPFVISLRSALAWHEPTFVGLIDPDPMIPHPEHVAKVRQIMARMRAAGVDASTVASTIARVGR